MFLFNNANYSKKSDEELLALVAEGKHKAFDEIYKRYSTTMVNFFYKRLAFDEYKAQDFCQDLFLKVIENAAKFKTDKNFKVWLYTIAYNKCKNEYRSHELKTNKIASLKLSDTSENDIFKLEKHDSNLFNFLLNKELQNIGDKHRTAFELRHFDHLSVKEISIIMDCPEGTVKSRLFNITKKLAEQLNAFDPKIKIHAKP
jgi:RNA polymerase sigma-70 factor (ECF subfamily)